MTNKIYRSILIVSLSALLACLCIVIAVLYGYFTGIQKSRLKAELDLAVTGVTLSGEKYLDYVSTADHRLTWIDKDGKVLFDSKVDTVGMASHADREEFKEAVKSGFGESERYSATLTAKTLYCASRLEDGSVLRISVEHMTVISLLMGMLQPLMIVFFVILIAAGVLAHRMAKNIVRPLNELDINHPTNAKVYPELSPLLNRIDTQMKLLQRKKDEFEQITGSMRECLVLLDDKHCVISINKAAMKLFNTNEDCIGTDFRTLYPALESLGSAVVTDTEGKQYQMDISKIEYEGNIAGSVLLAFDITDRVCAEQHRREFTANVSHELKTPLQSIMGSSELIENGMVKPEDMTRFIGRIRQESSRLVALIDDIMRLSQLDERCVMAFETVDLYDISASVTEDLRYIGDAKNISITLRGDHVYIRAVRKLMYDIIYNLCDNGIKYNNAGGSVNISIAHDDKNAVITVSDTGIGIPPEHRDRVFERFYRVDKSHSRASGGTGLGLSIVKHAALYHSGKVELRALKNGSEFKVTLPLYTDFT